MKDFSQHTGCKAKPQKMGLQICNLPRIFVAKPPKTQKPERTSLHVFHSKNIQYFNHVFCLTCFHWFPMFSEGWVCPRISKKGKIHQRTLARQKTSRLKLPYHTAANHQLQLPCVSLVSKVSRVWKICREPLSNWSRSEKLKQKSWVVWGLSYIPRAVGSVAAFFDFLF